jgi:hypothetical protein
MHIIEDNEQDIPSLRKANAQLFNTVLRLQAQYGVMVKQRDQERRNYCYYVAADRSNPDHPNYEPYCDLTSARKVADKMGWDCFDNDNNNGDK